MSLLSTAKADFWGFFVVVVSFFPVFLKSCFLFYFYFLGRKRMRDIHIFHARI